MKEVTQSVTVPSSVELAPQLEELAGLGLQIVRSSRELQTAFQSDLSRSSASVCALLPVALSNAQSCLSLLQLILNQTPTPLPPPSSFIPPAAGPLSRSPVLTEPDHSGSPIEPHSGEWSTIRTRLDTPAVDPRFSAMKSSPPVVHTPYLPDNSLGAGFFSRPTTPATQRWPIFESSIRSTLGGHFDDEPSPTSPLLSSAMPTRRSISIAEIVDEENSSLGTLGGVNTPRPTVARTNVSSVHSNPPLSISVIDVTTGPTLATHEVPGGRVTRSSTKRKAADDSGVGGGPSKWMKSGPS